MRIYLYITPNTYPVPYDHLPVLVGCIHRWLGENNELHGNISLHSFSWLQSGKRVADGLDFKDGAWFYISFYREEQARRLVRGILDHPQIKWGMTVKEIRLQETPLFGNEAVFNCGSPIFIKRLLPNGKVKHYTFEDAEAPECLVETLRMRMAFAGLPEDGTLKIEFTDTMQGRIKKVNYKSIENKASLCPVHVFGKPETLGFIWNVGLGNSTGIGLGAVY